MEVNFLQSSKQLIPIVVMVEGSVMDVKLACLKKHLSSMPTTVYSTPSSPLTFSGIMIQASVLVVITTVAVFDEFNL